MLDPPISAIAICTEKRAEILDEIANFAEERRPEASPRRRPIVVSLETGGETHTRKGRERPHVAARHEMRFAAGAIDSCLLLPSQRFAKCNHDYSHHCSGCSVGHGDRPRIWWRPTAGFWVAGVARGERRRSAVGRGSGQRATGSRAATGGDGKAIGGLAGGSRR